MFRQLLKFSYHPVKQAFFKLKWWSKWH